MYVFSARLFDKFINILIKTNESTVSRETPDSDNDATCAELKADEGWKSSMSNNSRPISISSEPEKRWVDIVSGNYLRVMQNIKRFYSVIIVSSTINDGICNSLHLWH